MIIFLKICIALMILTSVSVCAKLLIDKTLFDSILNKEKYQEIFDVISRETTYQILKWTMFVGYLIKIVILIMIGVGL